MCSSYDSTSQNGGKRKKDMNKKFESRQVHRGRVGRRTKEMVEIAKERIRILLTMAEAEVINNRDIALSKRYVELARKLGMRYNIRIQKDFRYKICRSCNAFLGSSATSRVRCSRGRIIIYCKNCGKITRIPLR